MDVLLTLLLMLAVSIPCGFGGAVLGIWVVHGDSPVEQYRLMRRFRESLD